MLVYFAKLLPIAPSEGTMWVWGFNNQKGLWQAIAGSKDINKLLKKLDSNKHRQQGRARRARVPRWKGKAATNTERR